MIFTIVGIILRCLAYAILWNSVDKHPIFCNIILVVYIILCVLGIIETYMGRYKRPAIATVLLFIVQIVASVYFGFAADSLIGKIIGCVVIFLIFGGVTSIFPDTPVKPGLEEDSQDTFDLWGNMCEENLKNVQAQQEDYYSRLREINYAKRYGESGELHTSNGDKIELNDDGSMFKDKDGNWHYV